MKVRFIFGLLLLTLPVRAELAGRITGNEQADVNGKVIDSRELKLNIIPQRTYETTGRSALSDIQYRTTTAPTGTVNLEEKDNEILRRSRGSRVVIPQQNFTAKHARGLDKEIPTKEIARKDVPTDKAAIKDRTIPATTPAGEAELVEQLKKLQTR